MNWISLPKEDKDIDAGLKCSVAGWGRNTTKGHGSKLLLQADVSIMKREECKQAWKSTFTAKMLCTGGKAGFCQVSFQPV